MNEHEHDLTADNLHMLAGGTVRRIFGPPGTGKTTTLAKATLATAQQRGADAIALVSFTTTAARAIAEAVADAGSGSGIVLPDRAVGTLHSMSYRAIGTPDVALDPKAVADWNASCPAEWRIKPDGRRSSPDMAADVGLLGGGGAEEEVRGGDALLGQLDMLRSTLTPVADWPVAVRAFAQRWSAWKTSTGVVDFADMILGALDRALQGEPAPGRPSVFISDETQDCTPAELALILTWGRLAGTTVLAGDDDQAINDWRGGSAAPLLRLDQSTAEVVDRVLEQSYRVPASVHAVAERWIRRVSNRHEKPYHSRAEVGEVYLSPLSFDNPRLVARIGEDVAAGRSVMVIASCGYMLTSMIGMLRREGIPYSNRFRPAEPRWNPLRSPTRGMGVPERLYRYLVVDEGMPARVRVNGLGEPVDVIQRHRRWTGDDLRAWLPMIAAKGPQGPVLTTGTKGALETLPHGEVPWPLVAGLFADPDARNRAAVGDLDWITAAGTVTKTYADKLAYPARVARRYGGGALEDEPLVTIGTIHSVKGGGADVVYLSPDISRAASGQWYGGEAARDPLYRQFYVGATRAKQTLVLCGSAGGYSIPPRLLLPTDLEVRGAA